MSQLRDNYQLLQDKDIVVAVAGPDSAAGFRDYWQKEELPFIGLPDPRHKILKLYGQEIKIFKFGRMPAQALIDKSGMIRFIVYGNSMADIPDVKEVIRNL